MFFTGVKESSLSRHTTLPELLAASPHSDEAEEDWGKRR
jgi:hypothetical protein